MLRDKHKITSFCDVLKYLRRIRGDSEGLGHSEYPVENVSAEIPSFNEHIPDNMVAWEGIGYLTAKESVPQFLQSSQQPWKGREYDLAGKSTVTTTVVSFTDDKCHQVVWPNSKRRSLLFVVARATSFMHAAPYFYKFPDEGIFIGENIGIGGIVPYLLVTDRDWGGMLYGSWFANLQGAGHFFLTEDVWL